MKWNLDNKNKVSSKGAMMRKVTFDFCGVNCGFHAIKEAFPGSELSLWMTSWFHVLIVE